MAKHNPAKLTRPPAIPPAISPSCEIVEDTVVEEVVVVEEIDVVVVEEIVVVVDEEIVVVVEKVVVVVLLLRALHTYKMCTSPPLKPIELGNGLERKGSSIHLSCTVGTYPVLTVPPRMSNLRKNKICSE